MGVQSCTTKTESAAIYGYNEYLKESHSIKHVDFLKTDVISNVVLDEYSNYTIKPIIRIELFNYGGDIQINTEAIPDIYSDLLWYNVFFKNVDKNMLTISRESNNNRYGDYGFASLSHPDGTHLFNIFISPMAYSYINSNMDNDDEELILAILINYRQNIIMPGIFLADKRTADYIRDFSDYIRTEPSQQFNGPNEMLWKPLDFFKHP